MNPNRLITSLAAITLLVSTQVLGGAEATQKSEVKPDNWNRSVKLEPLTSRKLSSGEKFTRNNQLRCWQNGDLIVLENNWKPLDAGKGSLLKSGKKRLHTYDYGETFCIYLGD